MVKKIMIAALIVAGTAERSLEAGWRTLAGVAILGGVSLYRSTVDEGSLVGSSIYLIPNTACEVCKTFGWTELQKKINKAYDKGSQRSIGWIDWLTTSQQHSRDFGVICLTAATVGLWYTWNKSRMPIIPRLPV